MATKKTQQLPRVFVTLEQEQRIHSAWVRDRGSTNLPRAEWIRRALDRAAGEPPRPLKRAERVPVRLPPVKLDPWRDERYTLAWRRWREELERDLCFSDWVRAALEQASR